MIYRAAIANIEPLALATALQLAGVSATVSQAFGCGSWGVEPTAIAEVAPANVQGAAVFLDAVCLLLRSRAEECAYLTVNGVEAFLLYPDGKRQPLAA